MLVVREPPSDLEYTPRQINGVVVKSPLELWDDGCRIYMTAVPNVFRAWRTEAAWHGGGQIDSQPPGFARILALSTATEHASNRASFVRCVGS